VSNIAHSAETQPPRRYRNCSNGGGLYCARLSACTGQQRR
jgi:hypothetical protein